MEMELVQGVAALDEAAAVVLVRRAIVCAPNAAMFKHMFAARRARKSRVRNVAR